jgi:predicted TPR repeat methyltransferase
MRSKSCSYHWPEPIVVNQERFVNPSIEEWNDRYCSAGASDRARLWHSLPSPDLISLVAPLPVGAALDVATGDGRNAIWLAHAGWSVTGIDFSTEAVILAGARAEAEEVGIELVTADARTWQPDRYFDLVTITYLQLKEADLFRVIARAASWLSPHGHFILIGHDVANLRTGAPGPRDREVLNTPEQLTRAAHAAGLRVLQSDSRERVQPERADEPAVSLAIDTVLHATTAR